MDAPGAQSHRGERKQAAARPGVEKRRACQPLRAQHFAQRALGLLNARLGEDAEKACPVAPEGKARNVIRSDIGPRCGYVHACVVTTHNCGYETGSSRSTGATRAATLLMRYSRRHSSIIVSANSRCMFEKPPRCPASNCRTIRRSNRSASGPVSTSSM